MRAVLPLLAFGLFACSPHREEAPKSTDLVASRVRAALGMPAFREHGVASTGAARVTASKIASLAEPLRIADGAYYVDVSIDGVRPTSPREVDGARVFASALDDTDVVHVETREGFEELRLLGERAATTAQWRLHAGPNLSLRLREGHVEAFDANGYVHLATASMFLVDANGTQRWLQPTLTREGDDHVLSVTFDREGLVAPIALDPLWTTAAPMLTPRIWLTPHALTGGKAIVAGGQNAGGTILSNVEIYDSATNTWSAAAPLLTARKSHAGVAFTSGVRAGQYLLTGGANGPNLSTTELYNPATNTWTAGPALKNVYTEPNATLTGTKALIYAGGTTADVYDSATNTMTATGAPVGTHGFTPVGLTLSDGRVLFAGSGTYGTSTNLAEVYRPGSNDWAAVAALPVAMMAGGSIVVGSRAYYFGGTGWYMGVPSSSYPSVFIYDVAANTWTTGAPLISSGGIPLATPYGKVLVFESVTTDLFDPATGKLTVVSSSSPAGGGKAIRLDNGKVLFLGSTSNTLFSLYAPGAACTAGWECTTGNCVDGVCCSSASCALDYSCNTKEKPGTCAKVGGARCTTASECASGFCVDSVCCNAACGGQCQACDVAGSVGTCTPVIGAPHGPRTSCVSSTDVCKQLRCDGTDVAACHYPGSGVVCGVAACSAGVETHVSACSGTGNCLDVPKACGGYGCAGATCKSSCSTNADCSTGFGCDTAKGLCLPLSGLGKSCDSATPCTAGLFCVDGVCCGRSSCGADATCAWPGREGQCTRKNGYACATSADCGSGFCTDGVCCESKCDGLCEACATLGSEGKCVPVVGAPSAAHGSCPSDSTNACASRACDGVDRAACQGYVGAAVMCRIAACAEGAQTASATCDGKGACPAAITTPCDGYKCEGDACKTGCAADADCLDGYLCLTGRCRRKTAQCSADGLSVVAVDGTLTACAPFVCKGGVCGSSCATSNDCVSGATCDPGTKTCVQPAPPGSDDGGCTMGHGGKSSSAWSALAILGVAFLLRRRQMLAALGIAAAGCSKTPHESPVQTARALAPIAFASGSRPLDGLMIRGELSAALPARANENVHLANERCEVDVVADDLGAAPAAHDGDALVYDLGDVEVIRRGTADGFSEVRVVHRASDELTLRYRVRPKNGAVRVRENKIEIVDDKGYVMLSTAPFVAFARERSVTATLSLEGDLVTARFDSRGMSAPIVIDPVWTTTSSMNIPRYSVGAAVLPNGKVVACGGVSVSSSSVMGNCELYDPALNTWSNTPPIASRRYPSVAVVTSGPNAGTIVVAGGTDSVGGAVLSVQSWNPAVGGLWTTVGSTASAVIGAASAGTRVFLLMSSAAATVTPGVAGFGTPTGAPQLRAYGPSLTTINGDRVLIVSGQASGAPAGTTVVDVYDPATNAVTARAAIPIGRRSHAAVSLDGNRVLVAGGSVPKIPAGVTYVMSAYLYDYAANSWTAAGDLLAARENNGLVKLTSNSAIVLGGTGPSSPPVVIEHWSAPATLGGGGVMPAAGSGPIVPLATGGAMVFDGSGTVRLYMPQPLGAACTLGPDCASGNCVDGVCCSTASCSAGASCATPTKKGTCAKPLATACGATSECESGFCVDGVCCNSACGSQCQACDVPGRFGTCSAVTGAVHGTRSRCANATSTNVCARTYCDGTDVSACHFLPSGVTPCGAATCTAGTETHTSTCNGAGVCSDTPRSCGVYICGTNACKTTCASNSDCVSGYYCASDTSSCTPLESLGRKCTDGSSCKAGLFCTDGVCCGVASCGSSGSCAVAGSEGVCKTKNGTTCAADTECGSGNCVDGVCCDSACTGQCEACDNSGALGTCTPVTGAPHAPRKACAKDDATPCANAQCDGTDRGRCAGLPGSAVSCRAASCVGTKLTAAAECDGKGACPAEATVTCGGYRCADDGKTCRTDCASATDCETGFVCTASKCERPSSACSPDGLSIVDGEGNATSCAPYRCADGKCKTACAASTDCIGGRVCDSASGACVDVSAPPVEDGGGCAAGGRPAGSFALLSLTLGLLLRARRRGATAPRRSR